eukprot:4157081-Prymnesium_polylepis.1
MQSAHAYNASFATAERKGRISHLRVPFCLANAKAPDRYRAHKHAPQAFKCMHLGYLRSKTGCVLEILEGPRQGKVIIRSLPPLR